LDLEESGAKWAVYSLDLGVVGFLAYERRLWQRCIHLLIVGNVRVRKKIKRIWE
jgi:hypothetical protein